LTLQFWYASLLLILDAALALWLVYYTWTKRQTQDRKYFAALMTLCSLWAMNNALEICLVDPGAKILVSKLAYLVILNVPPLWFLYALRFGMRKPWFSGSRVFLLWIIPAITLVMVFTNEYHRLFWSSITSAGGAYSTLLIYRHGPAMYFWTAYSYILLLAGMALFFWTALNSSRIHRRNILVLLIGCIFPWTGNILYLAGITVMPGVDLTPIAFTLMGAVLAWNYYYLHILSLIPVAREMIIESMGDGVIVLDAEDRVVDINPAARKLLGKKFKDSFDGYAAKVIPEWDRLASQSGGQAEGQAEIQLENEGVERWLDARMTPLYNAAEQFTGRVLVLRDITWQRQVDADLRKLSQAVDASPISIVITRMDGLIEFVNPYFTQLTGYSTEEVIGKSPKVFASGLTPPETYREMWEALRKGEQWKGEFINRKKNGELYWERAVIGPVMNSHNEVTHYIAFKEDITDKVREEAAERDQRALAEALRDTAAALNSTLNLEEVLDRILINIEKVVPYDAVQVVLINEGQVQIARTRGLTVDPSANLTAKWLADVMNYPDIRQMIETRQPVFFPNTRLEPDWVDYEESQWALSKMTVPIITDEQVIGFFNLLSSTEGFYTSDHATRLLALANQASTAIQNARLYTKVQRLATVDSLTGLYNRRALYDFGRREIQRVQLFRRSLSVLFIDIDYFKRFNDSYSYTVGDQMLRAVSDCLKDSIRDVDLIGRYGGEEIVILLPEINLAGAVKVAERLRRQVESLRVETESAELSVTVSIGVATYISVPGDTASLNDLAQEKLDELIEKAGQQLHVAKANGRNRVAF